MAQKVALITGAGSGIGKVVSIALAKEGYSLVLAGRRMERLETTVNEIKQACPNTEVLAVAANVTEPESVAALFAQAKEKFGRLDLLFNNAGYGGKGALLEDLEFKHWKAVLDTNMTGTFLCMQQAFKIMKDQQPQGGRIINNGSVGAHSPRPNSAPYTSTKHGITGLTKSGSLDGRKYNIAVGQIDIGNAATEMTGNMEKGVPQANGTRMPEPTMDPADVARAVVYMASLPLGANVQFMLVMATKMPLVGRG